MARPTKHRAARKAAQKTAKPAQAKLWRKVGRNRYRRMIKRTRMTTEDETSRRTAATPEDPKVGSCGRTGGNAGASQDREVGPEEVMATAKEAVTAVIEVAMLETILEDGTGQDRRKQEEQEKGLGTMQSHGRDLEMM
mmetsp:Transcript_22459/g.40551  ORF Transcript_22459/g.40551 Transcript_22459/m.40551 type:complete len:138 (+) Transcript_22459:486-899(+)